ncbi:Hsp20/alpha crystallin family protein [Methylocystis sp.]|uniref:Hsp20/alpha crystallin family protein n=1 Tax=Methylocystis sp. TaxID=1911079 RepID=UPI003D0F5C72
MTKRDWSDKEKEDVTGAAGLAKIARGLSELFNTLADFDKLPRRGRHEKDGRVMEYSFGVRPLREAAGEEEEAAEEEAPRPEASHRRAAKRTSIEVLEPVTDMFDEPSELVFLFELPGVEREDIRCILDGDILLLEAKTGDRLYRKEMLVEEKLAPGAPQLNLRNGVLEARLSKQPR